MSSTMKLLLIGIIVVFTVLGVVLASVLFYHFSPRCDVQVIHSGRYRKLTKNESAKQRQQDRACHVIEESVCVSCMYNGKREYVTVPVRRVFDGDSLKRLFGIDSTGISWVVHDWLYATPHAFDSGTVCTRAHADAMFYELLSQDGVVHMVYASLTHTFDRTVSHVLTSAWNTDTGCNVIIE
jgi:hypothetical protein